MVSFLLFNKSKMPCNGVADLLAGVDSIVFAHNCEKSAVGIFVIVLLAVDEGKTALVIFHNRIRVFTTVDNAENKLLVRVASVKKSVDTHRLRGLV